MLQGAGNFGGELCAWFQHFPPSAGNGEVRPEADLLLMGDKPAWSASCW
jgi:hypothetical protein